MSAALAFGMGAGGVLILGGLFWLAIQAWKVWTEIIEEDEREE